MTIAIDFDGVIVEISEYRKGVYGKLKKGAKEFINKLFKKHIIIIYTCRCNEAIFISDFLVRNGIAFDYINHNPKNNTGSHSNKVLADYYIDDRAIEFKDNWKEIFERINNDTPTCS